MAPTLRQTTVWDHYLKTEGGRKPDPAYLVMLLEEQSIDTAIWRRRVALEEEREAKERQEAYYWALVDLLSRTVYSS
jgi:hypothetical protein